MMEVTRQAVIVRDLEIRLSIGVHAHERRAAQRLVVSVEVDIEAMPGDSDALATTLDYDAICDFIRALANEKHVALQETVARRILDFTLSLPGALSARVETRKPDVFEDCAYVGVRLEGRNA